MQEVLDHQEPTCTQRYIIVTHENLVHLESKVSNYLGFGFVPTGGVVYLKESYAQAMYRA